MTDERTEVRTLILFGGKCSDLTCVFSVLSVLSVLSARSSLWLSWWSPGWWCPGWCQPAPSQGQHQQPWMLVFRAQQWSRHHHQHHLHLARNVRGETEFSSWKYSPRAEKEMKMKIWAAAVSSSWSWSVVSSPPSLSVCWKILSADVSPRLGRVPVCPYTLTMFTVMQPANPTPDIDSMETTDTAGRTWWYKHSAPFILWGEVTGAS